MTKERPCYVFAFAKLIFFFIKNEMLLFSLRCFSRVTRYYPSLLRCAFIKNKMWNAQHHHTTTLLLYDMMMMKKKQKGSS